MNDFKQVTEMKYWCQKVLPLVYDDSLSYYELLSKIVKKLNDLIENNSKLPDYIRDLIKEYISSGAIGEVVRDLLTNFMLNVKNPPNDLTPAVGDGSVDDTEAIQGCIDYASEHGGMCVYFPSGVYLTQALTIKENVSLFGFDRYNTRVVLKGGSTTSLISGNVKEISISGMTLDGNMDIQVNNINLIDMNVDSILLSNMVLTDGYTLVRVTCNKIMQLDNLVFDYAVVKHMELTGSGCVSANNIYMHDISELKGECLMELQNNNSTFTNMFALGDTPLGYKIGGNNNNISGVIKNALVPYTDTGNNNSIAVLGVTETKKMTGDYKLYTGESSEVVKGVKTVTADSSKETLTQGKQLKVGSNYDVTVAGNKVESVTGNHTVNVKGNVEETIDARRTITITGADTTSVLESTENVTGKKTIQANEIELDTTEPLGYKEPEEQDEYFKSIPFQHNGVEYKVLVQGNNGVKDAIDNLTQELADETQARADADAGLEQKITDETTARGEAIKGVKDLIDAEKTAREDADNGLRTDIDNVIAKIDKNNIVNVLEYGAVGDGVADDSAVINKCIEDYGVKTIFLPSGYIFKVSSTILVKCRQFICLGTIVVDGDITGVQLAINDSVVYIHTLTGNNVGTGFNITADDLLGSIGNSDITINRIARLGTGIKLFADGNHGVQNETFHLNRIDDCAVGILCECGNKSTPWINQNTFYGGWVMGGYDNPTFEGVKFVKGTNQTDRFNGNAFYNMSFEQTRYPIILDYCWHNKFENLRLLENEGDKLIQCTATCEENYFIGNSTYMNYENVSDAGISNVYEMAFFFEGGNNICSKALFTQNYFLPLDFNYKRSKAVTYTQGKAMEKYERAELIVLDGSMYNVNIILSPVYSFVYSAPAFTLKTGELSGTAKLQLFGGQYICSNGTETTLTGIKPKSNSVYMFYPTGPNQWTGITVFEPAEVTEP